MVNALYPRTPDQWIFYSLLLLIAWLPIPLGSNRPLGWGIMQIVAFSLLFSWTIIQLFMRQSMPHITGSTRVVLLLFLSSLVYQLLQTTPLSLETIRLLSPTTYQVYSITQPEIAKASFSISLDLNQTVIEFLKSAAYLSIFFLTLVLVDSRKRLRQLAYLLILVGFAQSLLGLLDVYLGGILFNNPFGFGRFFADRATGTYINSNHFAGLLELAIPIGMGMILAQSQDHNFFPNWQARLLALTNWLLSGKARLSLYLIIMFTALFYSGSRGGFFSLIIATIVTLVALVLFRGFRSREARLLSILVLPLFAVSWLGAGLLASKLEKGGLKTNRHPHREAAYQMIADYPLFGIGNGNWHQVYPAYKNPEIHTKALLLHVHNDYLELLAEQGAVGFVLFGSAVLITFATMSGALRRRRDPLMRGVLFGCVTATLSLLIHALFDFNFHIPANAAWFSVILAMGLVAARMPHDA